MINKISLIGCFLLATLFQVAACGAVENDTLIQPAGSIPKWTVTQQADLLELKTLNSEIFQEISLKQFPFQSPQLRIYIKEGNEAFSHNLVEEYKISTLSYFLKLKPQFINYLIKEEESFKRLINTLYKKDKTLPVATKELFFEYGTKFLMQASCPSLRPQASRSSSSSLIDIAAKHYANPSFLPVFSFSWTAEVMKGLSDKAVGEQTASNNMTSFKKEKAPSPAKETPFPFTREQLEDIYRSSLEIVSLTNPEDMLVFLGRSPLWLAETLKTLNVERKMFTVAFSGRPYCDKVCLPSAVQKESFFKYLHDISLTEEKIINCTGKIVIIDYIETGESVHGFFQILSDYTKKKASFLKEKILLINLTYAALSSLPWKKANFLSKQTILMKKETLDSITSAKDHDSLGVYYPYWQWDKMNPLERKPAEQALSHQKKLRDFLQQHSSSRSRVLYDDKKI